MERYVKERLVGAAVLVAAGIILIPEMLSGPKDSTERGAVAAAGESEGTLKSYSIDLTRRNEVPARTGVGTTAAAPGGQPPATNSIGTAAAAESKVQTAAAPPSEEGDAQPPTPQANAKDRAAGSEGPADSGPAGGKIGSTDDAAKSPAVERATPPADSVPKAGGGWAVQIASYATAARAQEEVAAIKGKGFEAFVMPFKMQNKTLYRVRVGPQGDRSGADAVAAKLKAKGIAGAIVKHP